MSQRGLEFICDQLRRVTVDQNKLRELIQLYDAKVREYELRHLEFAADIGVRGFAEQKNKYARDALRPVISVIQQQYVADRVAEHLAQKQDSLANAKRLGLIP